MTGISTSAISGQIEQEHERFAPPANSTSLVLLAYGEQKNLEVLLPSIVEELNRLGDEYEILVVDAASPMDDSRSVCERYSARYVNQEEPFFGGALRTAIKCAAKERFVIMDADCSQDPSVIPLLVNRFRQGDCDMVIGSRYVEGGISDDSKTSLAMSRFLNGAFRHAMKVNVHDLSIDCRLYRTADLKKLALSCENYDVLQEIILKLKLHQEMSGKGDFRIVEVPIEFRKRAYGKSKRQLVKFIMNYLKTLIKLWTLRSTCEKRRETPTACEPHAEFVANALLYLLIGCAGAVIDYVVFLLVILVTGCPAPDTIFQFAGLPEIANAIGCLAGFLFCFYFNTFYNFITRDHLAHRFVLYAVVVMLGTCLSTVLMFLLRPIMGVLVAKAICVASAAVVQFVLNRAITYRRIPD